MGVGGSEPFEPGEYALIGDLATAALVSRDGSIDWLCLPGFDSLACFATVLGDPDQGRWRIAPAEARYEARRHYRNTSLILETEFRTADGAVRLIDFMPPRDGDPTVVRVVQGLRGRVSLTMELRPRFGHGISVPAVERIGGTWRATAGPDTLWLHSAVHVREDGGAEFSVGRGERRAFVLVWRPSHRAAPPEAEASALLTTTDRYWTNWTAKLRYAGSWRDEVLRSLVTIRAMSDASAGGVLAAATSSLPGVPGAAPTPDFRCCRLAEASATFDVLFNAGVVDDAVAWRDWLLRATAGPPEQIQGVYGPAGERYVPVQDGDWPTSRERTRPVREVGPGIDCGWHVASAELLRAGHLARREGLQSPPLDSGAFLRAFQRRGAEPDHGVWASPGPRKRYVHSQAMVWAGTDAMIKMIEWYGLPGDAGAWRRLRSDIRTEILRQGVDRDRRTFVRAYGERHQDAALLRLPAIGIVSADDPLVLGTIRAVRDELSDGSLVRRFRPEPGVDGDGPLVGDQVQVVATFWLAEALAITGHVDEAQEAFETGLGVRTDLGMLAEQYDLRTSRPAGNFPSTGGHVALVGAALRLDNPTRRATGSGFEIFFPR